MIHQISARLLIVTAVAVVVMVAGIALGEPAVVLLGAPAAVVVVAGVVMHQWPDLRVTVAADRARAVEGDEMAFLVEIRSLTGTPWVELDLELPPDFEPVDGSARIVARIPPHSAFVVPITVRLRRWGLASPTRLTVKARDRFGLFVSSFVQRVDSPVRIHPTERQMQALLSPPQLRVRLGDHTSRARGTGFDYADVRAMQRGDPARAINWRVSARRRETWVTQRHPERSADVVLFVDRLHWVGPDSDSSVQLAVRAALALAETHIAAQDRVGLLDVGRDVRWFQPRLGRGQLHRLVDALLEVPSRAERVLGGPTTSMLPLRSLSAGTLVVALTSLLDEQPLSLLHELRSRGYDVVVVECDVGDRIPPPTDEVGRLARQLWAVERAASRQRLRALGMAVVTWREDEPLAVPITALRDVRRVSLR